MRLCLATLMLLSAIAANLSAATFEFSSSSSPINGLVSGDVTVDGVTMSLEAQPAGAVFRTGNSGMGINSRGVAGVVDPEIDKFDVLGGTAAGTSDAFTFSFDHDGILTSLDFDGVKDESFEFFRLETPGGQVLSIFDQQIGLRLIDISLISEPNVTLLTEEGSADDDLFGLSIPFSAGEEFSLIYGEYIPDPANYQPGFTPEQGNGGRFAGVTVELVPEPTSIAVLLIGLGGAAFRRRAISHPNRIA